MTGSSDEALERLEDLIARRRPRVHTPLTLAPAQLALAEAWAATDPPRARIRCDRVIEAYGTQAPEHPHRRKAQVLRRTLSLGPACEDGLAERGG